MLVDRTDDAMMRLLVDATRRASCSGPDLAKAHRAVGRALAADVAQQVSLEEVQIDHVAGPSTGVQIRKGDEPIFIAMLRAGLFLAEGLWECFPGSTLLLHDHHQALHSIPASSRRPIVIVDAVVNSGRSLGAVLDALPGVNDLTVVTLVAFRETMAKLEAARPRVTFIVGRLSDRSFVGSGTTDTGGRLFGTTSWD
jgi:uracil phosphoribosyltransferase